MRRAIRQRKLSLIERQMTQSEAEAEAVKQIIEKLLVAIFKKFSAYLPPLGWFRERYSSEDILDRLEEYFDGEDLTAFRKFYKRFVRRQPAPPGRVNDGPQIDRLERYESRAWTRQMRATRSFIEIRRSIET
jgi:hypothetical protein